MEMEMEHVRAESGNWEERGSRSGTENALCLMGFSILSFCGMMIWMS